MLGRPRILQLPAQDLSPCPRSLSRPQCYHLTKVMALLRTAHSAPGSRFGNLNQTAFRAARTIPSWYRRSLCQVTLSNIKSPAQKDGTSPSNERSRELSALKLQPSARLIPNPRDHTQPPDS